MGSMHTQGGYVYVGLTANPTARLLSHDNVDLSGKGAAWTGLHSPVKLLFSRPARVTEGPPELDEDRETKRQMWLHGIGKVRGGSHCSPVLKPQIIFTLQREIAHANGACFHCRQTGHFAHSCPNK